MQSYGIVLILRSLHLSKQTIIHLILLKIDIKVLSVLLSDLKKNGWLEVSLSQEDSRKRLYKLKSPEIAIQSMEKP